MQYRRISIQRTGFAVVPGNTDEEALENAVKLPASAFDWEPMSEDLIREEAEVIEVCGPNGEI